LGEVLADGQALVENPVGLDGPAHLQVVWPPGPPPELDQQCSAPSWYGLMQFGDEVVD